MPRREDFQRVFDEQNPWFRGGGVPPSLAPPVERPLAQRLWRRILHDGPRRHQLILGPRRVGKTTVLYQTVRRLLDAGIEAQRLWWLRMDHPLLLQANLGDLLREVLSAAEATAARPAYVMLDELVYAADWDLWLKTFHDEQWPVRIAATSSATAALGGRRTESGVGRWAEQRLMPYAFDEFLDLLGQPPGVTAGPTLADTLLALPAGARPAPGIDRWRQAFLLTGGFPELLVNQRRAGGADGPGERDASSLLLESQRVLRGDAVERAVYKDIPQSFGVDNPMLLERLLYTLAGQMPGLLSPSSLCRDLGVSQPTFDRYLSYLERAFLVFTLPNYSGREAAVQRRGRKLYFVDGAIRNAALQRGLAPLADPVELGLLVENLVAASLQALAVQTGVRLHHWRDGRLEVDLVFADPRQPLAFEVGMSPGHSRKGLAALIARHEQFRGHSYLVTPQCPVLHAAAAETGIGTLPLDTFLIAIGAQARRALDDHLGAA